MKNWRTGLLAAAGLMILVPYQALMATTASAPSVAKRCMNCHQDYKDTANILAGGFKSMSSKAKSIQVAIDERMELVKFNDQTEVRNVAALKDLKDNVPVRVLYEKRGSELVARSIVAKPEIKVPEEQLMNADEVNKGSIEGSLNIPLDDLQTRLAELPKDKEIIVHCETGTRAQMAYAALKNAGFAARFLDDRVAFIDKRPICCFKE